MSVRKTILVLAILAVGLVIVGRLLKSTVDKSGDSAANARATDTNGVGIEISFVGDFLGEGQILAMLFDNEQDFLNRSYPLQRCHCCWTGTGGAQCEFSDLPPGRYAVMAFHDRNLNSKLDQNALGMPIEAYGFSNNARQRFGPPGFAACAFELSDPVSLEIKLH